MSTKLVPGMIITADLGDADITPTTKKVLFCEANGSRRVLWAAGITGSIPMSAARLLEMYNRRLTYPNLRELLAGSIPIYAVNPPAAPWWKPGVYVDYDGTRRDEPVNQVPDVEKWMRHTTTFAHEIDTLYADHTHQLRQRESYRTLPDMPHNDESNMRNQNGLQYGRGVCGYVFDKILAYSKLPHDQGGSGVLARDWRMQRAGVLEDVEALCLTCDHAHWLRQFIVKHDMAAWRAALDELIVVTRDERTFSYMRCPKIDRSSIPWQPAAGNIATFSGNAPLNWWKRHMVNWGEAVDYYDDHYGRREA